MTIYKVMASEWHYWKSSYESGYVDKEYLFVNKSNAEKFVADVHNNPYWFNFERKKVFNNQHSVLVEMSSMETED